MYKLSLSKARAESLLYAIDTALNSVDGESQYAEKRENELRELLSIVERQFGINKGAPVA